MKSIARGTTLATAAFILSILPGLASGQDAASTGEPLQLKSRVIDVHINENLAILTYTFTVFNPGRTLAEGQFSFDVPLGATGVELTLLRNISSADRAGKLMDPAEAVAIYEAVKRKDLSFRTVTDLDLITFGVGNIPALGFRNGPTTATAGGAGPGTFSGAPSLPPRPGGRITLSEDPVRPTGPGGQIVSAPAAPSDRPGFISPPTPAGMAAGQAYYDPAVLECLSPTSYRIRCFPVLPDHDETVTVVFAMEIPESGGCRRLTLPCGLRSNAKAVAKAPENLSLTMISEGGWTEWSGASHEFIPAPRYAHGYEALRSLAGRPETFTLTYANGRASKPFDCTKVLDASCIAVPAAQAQGISTERALQAVRVRRLVEALLSDGSEADVSKARTLATLAKVVCRVATLIVIEQHELSKTARALRSQ